MGELLKGKVVVITGGNSGLGRAMAIAAAQEGAKLVINCRDAKKGQDAVAEIIEKSHSEAIYVQGDLTVVENCKKLIDRAEEQFGAVDGLINYAGILPAATLLDTEESLYNDVLNLNLRGTVFCTKYAVKSMIKRGKGGSIINIGSPHAYGGQEDRMAYACSKGALLAFTNHVANHYAKHQIRCNSMTIGWMITPGEMALRKVQGVDENWVREMGKKHVPMGRLQENEDFVYGSNYLLSDAASQVTGTILNVTGGMNRW